MPGTRPHLPGLAVQPFVALGRVVRRRRTALGLTQEEVADRCELHVTYVRGIEGGRRNPTFQTFWLLAAALETSLEALAGWTTTEVEVAGAGEA